MRKREKEITHLYLTLFTFFTSPSFSSPILFQYHHHNILGDNKLLQKNCFFFI